MNAPLPAVSRMFPIVSMLFRYCSGNRTDQIEPSMLFIHPGRGFSSDRDCDDLAHVRDVDAVSGDLAPIDIDRDVRLAEELLYFSDL